MKKNLIFAGLLCFTFLIILNFKQDSSIEVTTDVSRAESLSPKLNQAKLKKLVQNEEAEIEVNNLEEEFIRLSTNEIKNKIAEMEIIAERKRLFSSGSKEEIVTFMRRKQALNKVVLERQLRKLEENYL